RLTSATRQALAESPTPMTPPQLRDALSQRGLTQYADRLAVIHNTPLRLEKQGGAMKVTDGWVVTPKGKLAARRDSLDVREPPPSVPGAAEDVNPPKHNTNGAGAIHLSRTVGRKKK